MDGVSILYVLMFSPSLFDVMDAAAHSPLRPNAIPLGSWFIHHDQTDESLSWWQKTNTLISKHNFEAILEHWKLPLGALSSYLGGITFWVGNWIYGIDIFYNSVFRWLTGWQD